MKKKKIKTYVAAAFALAASIVMPISSYAHGRPHYGPRPGPYRHHVHHYSAWGRGGSHFWPGFVGGLVGSTLCPPPPPVVVAPPPVVPAPVVVAPSTPVVVHPTPVVVPARPVVYRAW